MQSVEPLMNVTRSPACALGSLAAIVVLGLVLGLGLGVGLKTSASTLCSALADAVAARLDEGLNEHNEAFEQQLANAGLPRLEVVEASPSSVDEAACAQPTPALAVAFEFSLVGEVEGLLSSKAAQGKLSVALAALMDGLVRPEDVSLSVVAGSVTISGLVGQLLREQTRNNNWLVHLWWRYAAWGIIAFPMDGIPPGRIPP